LNYLSSKNPYLFLPHLIRNLRIHFDDLYIFDIWRELNSNKRQFTWRRKDKSQASRIDYILANTNFKSRINWCKIKPVCIKYTDHQSVFLNFLSSVEEKGKDFWKINNSILNDKDYQDKINDIILKYSAKIK
jgi:hypothetical protein